MTGLTLDPATLLFSTAVMGFVMAAFAFSAAPTMAAQRRSLHCWGWAMMASGAAFLLYFLRGHIAWSLSFVGGNALILLVPSLALAAQGQLVGARVPWRWVAVVAAWSLSGVIVATVGDHDPQVGAITMSSGVAVLALIYARTLGFHPVARTLPGALFSAVVGALTALTFSWRFIIALRGGVQPINAVAEHGGFAHVGSLLMGGLFIAAASITFFSMVHELRRRETADSARRDGLTGLLNRAAFFDAVATLSASQSLQRYAIAMVDLDHFKGVNDTYGHQAGDQALAHMARLINSAARGTDLVGRYGGEEFCVLLRDCEAAAATRFGQRLVDMAARTEIRLADGRQLRCTLSVGIACEQQGADLDTVLTRADEALYQAKAQGRNRALTAV